MNPFKLSRVKTRKHAYSVLTNFQRKYLKTISSDVSADIEKGKQIKNQISYYETILDMRIRTQQCLNLANAIPFKSVFSAFCIHNEAVRLKQDDLRNAIWELTNSLIDARCDMSRTLSDEASSVIDSINKKRKRDVASENTAACLWESITALDDQLLTPFRDETVTKWHNKIHVIGIGKQPLKVLNQSPVQQISNMMMTDKERLLKRTRVARTEKEVIGKKMVAPETPQEIFDDNDFYAQLLRDLIDSKMANQNDPVALSQQWVKIKELQRKNRKSKAGVDRKASKGRRLR